MKKAKSSPTKDSVEQLNEDQMTSSAHFGGDDDETNIQQTGFDTTEFHFQLLRSNNITKKLATVFSSLVAKIKDLEAHNRNLLLENEEIKKRENIKDRIIIEKNEEISEKEKKIEEVSLLCERLERDLMKNRAKISQAMNLAFEKGAPELVEFIERDILSVSSKT